MRLHVSEMRKEYEGRPLCIIANGPSQRTGTEAVLQGHVPPDQIMDYVIRGDLSKIPFPIWTVIGGFRRFRESCLDFIMDHLSYFEAKPEAPVSKAIEDIFDRSRDKKQTIVCPVHYERHPYSVAYPLEEVVEETKVAYFGESLHYMLALAITLKVSQIWMIGTDYTDQFVYPEERAGNEFWIGYALARGIQVHLPHQSNLLSRGKEKKHPFQFYGYTDELMKSRQDLYRFPPSYGEPKP